MFCPVCGQQQLTGETRFCSRCGFLLVGVSEVVANGGLAPGSSMSQNESSPRKRGLKQGLFIFLLAFLAVPIVAIITVALRAPPFAVAFTAILLTVGGLLRMAYALMFESSIPGPSTLEERLAAPSQAHTLKRAGAAALPPHQSIPASDYVSPAAGTWRDTNELPKSSGSVTEGTTKLLQQERENQ